MANTSKGAVFFIANNGVATDPAADSLRLANSIDTKVVRTFATKTDRATANAAGATVGTHAYITDAGLSVFDDNTRTGTGGWSWVGPRMLADIQAHSVAVDTNSPSVEVANSGPLILPSKRLLHVTSAASIYASSGSVLGRVFIDGTNVTVPPNDQQLDAGAPWWATSATSVAWRQSVSFDFYVHAGPSSAGSPVSFSYRCLRAGGSVTGNDVGIWNGMLQVVDMGPAD